MQVFNNNIVQKSWAKGVRLEPIRVGIKSTNMGNRCYSSNEYNRPVMSIGMLQPGDRGRFKYESDYPIFRKIQGLLPQPEAILYLDIENTGGLYRPGMVPVKDYSVTSCAINIGDGTTVLRLIEDFAGDEAAMIRFIFSCMTTDYTITGWNIGYDMALLMDRYLYLNRIAPPNILSPVVDMLALYRHYITDREESFKLDFILRKNGLPGKIEFDGTLDELYRTNRPLYYEYNKVDVDALVALENKLHLFNRVRQIAKISGCLIQDAVSNMRIIESLCYKNLRENNMTFWNNPHSYDETFEYEGAFVYDPIPGVYNDVYCFDFKSLYPSIMMDWNIGIDTLVLDIDRIGHSVSHVMNEEHDAKYIIPSYRKTPVGTWFRTDTSSFMCTIQKMLLQERAKYKKLEGIDNYTTQWAYKIIANSIYGVMGTHYFRFSSRDVARSITGCAKDVNVHVGNEIRRAYSAFSKKDPIIYGDTDSLYIDASDIRDHKGMDKGDHIGAFINTVVIPEYCEKHSLSGDNLVMEDEYGKIGAIFFSVKKRYCLNTKDGIKLVGFKRSDTPPKAISIFRDVVELMFAGKITDKAMLANVRLMIAEHFMMTREWLPPYRATKDIDNYQKKEAWITGIETLESVYGFNREKMDYSRGMMVYLQSPPKTARAKKWVQTTLTIPEALTPVADMIVNIAVTEHGYKADTERHIDRVFKLIDGLKEVLR